jgi:NitT/TauT family transport system substrate-binding protein
MLRSWLAVTIDAAIGQGPASNSQRVCIYSSVQHCSGWGQRRNVVEGNISARKKTPPMSGGQLGRRQFLRSLAGVGLSAATMALLNGCAGQPSAPGVATETLETTSIKLAQTVLCIAPQYVAEAALKDEGFTDVQYVKMTTGLIVNSLVSGEIDLSMHFSAPSIIQIDAGMPITFLAGVHIGCWKLFGSEQIQTIADLKGKTVAITELGGSEHVFLSSIAASIGLDPNTDINWSTHPVKESKQLFAEGKIDAFLAFPPLAQELELKNIGHVLLNSMMDKPWSQYFCCMATTSREFLNRNPVATKRALRAILKASDICVQHPEQAAQVVVDKGFTDNYAYALKAMQEIPYNAWRGYDPTDTLRFYALRLRDAGMVKGTPDEIIANGANWRFLNELKQELPAYAPSARSSGLLCRVGEPG